MRSSNQALRTRREIDRTKYSNDSLGPLREVLRTGHANHDENRYPDHRRRDRFR